MPDVINKVISFISGDDDAVSDKDVLLKQLAKEISKINTQSSTASGR